jgi:hypothetical protein
MQEANAKRDLPAAVEEPNSVEPGQSAAAKIGGRRPGLEITQEPSEDATGPIVQSVQVLLVFHYLA